MKPPSTESRWAKMKRWAEEHEAGSPDRERLVEESARQQAEAKQRREAEKKAEERFGNILLAVLLSIIAMAMVAMCFAERFPVARRAAWSDSPGVIAWPSLLAALALTAAFSRVLKRRFERQMWSCLGFVLSLVAVGIPAHLLLSHLGLVLNGALDAGPAHTFRVPVVAKRRMKGNSKMRPEWFLQVRDWKSAQGLVDIQVPKSRYDLTPLGEPIEVETKPGFFGFEWIVRHS